MSVINNSDNTANCTILGIDPGYDRLGWAVASRNQDKWEKVELGCIITDRSKKMVERYQQIELELQKLIDQFKPTQTAIETLFFANNITTAMKVAEVRGIIIASLLRNNLPVNQYNPMKIKETVTGNGRADKKAIKKMVQLEFKLQDTTVLDDALDALGIVLTHFILSKNARFYA